MPDNNEQHHIFGSYLDETELTSLSGKYTYDWVEDSVLFDDSTDGNSELTYHREYLNSSFPKKKAKIILGFFIFFMFVVLSRVFYIQILQGSKYAAIATDNSQRTVKISAERGLIFDRKGIQLTKNIPNFSIVLMPQYLPRNERSKMEVISILADITNQDVATIKNIFEQYGSYSYESIIFKEDIEYETALKILIDAGDLPGIYIKRGSKRLYLDKSHDPADENVKYNIPRSLSHIIGYQGKLSREELDELYSSGYLPSDYIGKTGVEMTYESILRGKYGSKVVEIDALGKEQTLISKNDPTPGSYVKLSIDVKLQEALENILQNGLKERKLKRGAAVVLNPFTGEILAMVSLPTFDNNDFSGGIDLETYNQYLENEDKPLFNRAIGGTYPSGSTVKPAIAASALQEGIITPETSFHSTGGLEVESWFFPDWLPGGHGRTNVRKSIAWSVNTFYYNIGGGYEDFQGLGVRRITDYLRKFGFDQQLGIDIPGEAPGFLPSKKWKEEFKKERWYVGDTYNLSIGQGDLLATPLQVSALTSVIANGGTLYKPRVVKSVINPLEKIEYRADKEVINSSFIDPAHIRTVRLGMRDCVTYGACQRMNTLPFTNAGKTGTAQWSNTKDTHAWYTSFAPYHNPEIVVTMVLEEGGEGGLETLPIVKEFYEWWWENRESDV